MAGRGKWVFHVAITPNTTMLPLEPQEARGPRSTSRPRGPGLPLTFTQGARIPATVRPTHKRVSSCASVPNGD